MTAGFGVHLDDDQAEALRAVAKIDGVPNAEEVRRTITAPLT